ncbi:hypothetical protein BpHYR1_050021 [Brachionus plicatilis]|uniref:Uncharacterized protein n=1 Tax=Brachionus plicatilis TaxID=10195 RepID=A0A3M7S156_BRAPC|nr:hypothetical protein BpHYR1_050021 [Brachionus plicatilis]
METTGPLITSSENSSKFKAITTAIKLNELDRDQHDEQLNDVSFLLSVFDNIVGPNIIHVWRFDINCDNSLHPTPYLSDYLLKYISVHTLNGELYQDKLMGQIKYRLYFIKEVNCVVFSVFFDAAQADMNNVGSSGNLMAKSDLKNLNTLKNEKEYINSKSNAKLGSSAENVPTLNNCLSMIFPMDKKDSFFKTTLLNSNIFLNYFENVIMEFKVFAHIRHKVKPAIRIGILNLPLDIKTNL